MRICLFTDGHTERKGFSEDTMLSNIKGGSFTIANVNEDAFGYDVDCAWVLDGATGLNGKRLVAGEDSSDAQWYCRAFSQYLKENLANSQKSLTQIFSQGVKTVWAEFEKRAGGKVGREDVPCAAGTAIRIRDGYLEYVCVADCCLLVRFQDGTVQEHLDDTICVKDKESMAMAAEIARQKGTTVSQCKADILPRLRSVRMTMNTPEGYIALADDPESILQTKCGKIPLNQIRDVCMVSDGFSEYYNMFRLADTLEEFMDAVEKTPPKELFDRLLAAQREDEALVKYPRFKMSDDSTLLYFTV